MSLTLAEPLHAFYPELHTVEGDLDNDWPGRHVLILGGSVVHPEWSPVARALRERLTAALDEAVSVHNVAMPAHTTRDSLLKYAHLEGRAFDVVLLYHGINEARANNAPPDIYRDDYGHYAWYEIVNDFDGANPLRPFALPYTATVIARSLARRTGARRVVPQEAPHPEWLKHGADLKTPVAFRENLEEIARLAESRSQPLVLATFALHPVEGYSQDAFAQRTLDYSLHSMPTEGWGEPANVLRAVEAHNREIVDLHDASAGRTRLARVHESIPKDGAHFNDVCHLTTAGAQALVDAVLPEILGALSVERLDP